VVLQLHVQLLAYIRDQKNLKNLNI
jgi:hypothetical protein